VDTQTATLVAVAILALVVLAAFWRFGRVRTTLKAPGVSLDLDGSGDTAATTAAAPGVRLEDATSRAGSITAADTTGRGADARRLDAQGDVRVTSAPPPAGPKAEPPA
jgi:hypothetical protein